MKLSNVRNKLHQYTYILFNLRIRVLNANDPKEINLVALGNHHWFDWNKGKTACLQKMLYRKQRQLATNHPDQLINHNQDCKNQKSNEPLLKHCAEEITKKWEQYQRFVAVPTVKTETRFNRY